jgi:hypothetical protein
MRGTRFGNRSLAALFTGGMLRGKQAQKLHQCSWTLKACQGPHVRHEGDGRGQLYPPQSLPGLDHRGQAPGCDRLVALVLQTLEAVGVFAPRSDLVLKNDVLRRRGSDDFREPSQGGWPPIGPAPVAAIMPEQKGVEAVWGVFEIADGVFTRAGEIATGEWHGISAVRLDPVARFLGDQRRCHPPTVVPFCGQIAGEPGATGTRFIDEDEVCGLGLPLTDKVIEITLAGAKASQDHALGAVSLRPIGHRNRVLVDIHADEECARLRQS